MLWWDVTSEKEMGNKAHEWVFLGLDCVAYIFETDWFPGTYIRAVH